MNPARLWPAALIAVLAITVAANIYILRAAQDPNVYVVEKDYYRRAVAWDSVLAARARSEALGWTVALSLGALDPGGAPVEFQLQDRTGTPLAGLAIQVTAIHNADAGHEVLAGLRTDAQGRARGRLPLTRAGLWELRLSAERGGERWFVSLHRDARPGVTETP